MWIPIAVFWVMGKKQGKCGFLSAVFWVMGKKQGKCGFRAYCSAFNSMVQSSHGMLNNSLEKLKKLKTISVLKVANKA